jgi:hypothetical protein
MKNIILFELQKKQMKDYEKCHNYFGFKKIEILAFNYDGQGNALIKEDDEFSYASPKDLRFLFFSGWYKATLNNDFYYEDIHVFTSKQSVTNLDRDCLLMNLNNNPMLKYLLKKYMVFEYQEHVDLSPESIWREYQYLLDNNGLNKLFIQESLDNTGGL